MATKRTWMGTIRIRPTHGAQCVNEGEGADAWCQVRNAGKPSRQGRRRKHAQPESFTSKTTNTKHTRVDLRTGVCELCACGRPEETPTGGSREGRRGRSRATGFPYRLSERAQGSRARTHGCSWARFPAQQLRSTALKSDAVNVNLFHSSKE